jgi:hypothetical protein
MSADIFDRADVCAEGHERARAVVAFLLSEARGLGVHVGTNGDEIATYSTSRVPIEVIYALERALVENKEAVIAAIQQDIAARRAVS